jgi:hypothetical protein
VTVFEQKVSQLHSFSAFFTVFKVSCVENSPKSVTAQDFMCRFQIRESNVPLPSHQLIKCLEAGVDVVTDGAEFGFV